MAARRHARLGLHGRPAAARPSSTASPPSSSDARSPTATSAPTLPDKRFGLYPGADWDVWSHKYNLIGLLTYYHYTGNAPALAACRKIGDLLIATFPAKKSILAAGTHVGMAATSVLEPIVLLYRADRRRALPALRQLHRGRATSPAGPKIVATLLTQKHGRQDGQRQGLRDAFQPRRPLRPGPRHRRPRSSCRPVTNAWEDIVANRLYITGTASIHEHFRGDHELPNGGTRTICETCVTTTWIQLNLQLLRLTGEANYGDEIERSLYNHLAAAQNPRGDDWCYYTALEGRKHYDKGITCCHSSGPRGMALAPQAAYLRGHADGGDMLLVSTMETSQATLELGRQKVTVEQASEFPRRGHSTIVLRTASPATFGVKVRMPGWAVPAEIQSAGVKYKTDSAGWIVLPARAWNNGDRIDVVFHLGPRLIVGDYGNAGQAALAWGPFVLAFNQESNPGLPLAKTLGLVDVKPLLTIKSGPRLAFEAKVVGQKGNDPQTAIFVPFAEAGTGGSEYRVWLNTTIGGNHVHR